MSNEKDDGEGSISRRGMLKRSAGVLGAVGAASCTSAESRGEPRRTDDDVIRQSVAHWCFAADDKPLSEVELATHARRLGIRSVELIAPKHFPMLKEMGLTCAMSSIDMQPDPPFFKGFNNPAFHPRVIQATRDAIDACAVYGFPSVISFTGYSAVNPDDPSSAHISRADGIKNCVEGYKKIIGHAEKKGVVLNLEMLNSRDDTHPMKGHPGYQGDDLEYCIEVIDKVGSPHLKLLFDIYHVQVMQGDVIRRIRQLKDYIGHFHTAGNPGRVELDDKQELRYRPIMEAIAETGYQGYVGHEFIPTWSDKVAALEHAVNLCRV